MNDSLRQAVSDVLDYLLALQHEGVRPREARARLQAVRGRHPDLAIDLLAEEQAFDQSVHYDVLAPTRRRGDRFAELLPGASPPLAVARRASLERRRPGARQRQQSSRWTPPWPASISSGTKRQLSSGS